MFQYCSLSAQTSTRIREGSAPATHRRPPDVGPSRETSGGDPASCCCSARPSNQATNSNQGSGLIGQGIRRLPSDVHKRRGCLLHVDKRDAKSALTPPPPPPIPIFPPHPLNSALPPLFFLTGARSHYLQIQQQGHQLLGVDGRQTSPLTKDCLQLTARQLVKVKLDEAISKCAGKNL